MSAGPPLEITEHGVRIFVRVSPGARREGLEGTVLEPDGRCVLKVAVGARAEGGKANAALIGLLAKRWRVPKTCFEIVRGAGDRRKVILLRGPGAALAARIAPLLAAE
jgi:uncharacterized protein YggU (UPF0235/DUF167 family)